MGEIRTHGLLLRKTLLANDDGIVEFFTADRGKVSVGVKKLGRSKKRNADVDYFRLLELTFFQGRKSLSLRQATTASVFHVFSDSFTANQIGFQWLARLQQILPTEKPAQELFQTVTSLCGHLEPGGEAHFDAYFQMRVLDWLGLITRFDRLRGDVHFDPLNGRFAATRFPKSILIPNSTRQVLEFLRRSDIDTFYQKRDRLPLADTEAAKDILAQIQAFHQ